MFEYVTQKADISHEVVVQYVFQECGRLFVLAAVEESCNLLSEITETLQLFTFGQPPDVIMQKQLADKMKACGTDDVGGLMWNE